MWKKTAAKKTIISSVCISWLLLEMETTTNECPWHLVRTTSWTNVYVNNTLTGATEPHQSSTTRLTNLLESTSSSSTTTPEASVSHPGCKALWKSFHLKTDQIPVVTMNLSWSLNNSGRVLSGNLVLSGQTLTCRRGSISLGASKVFQRNS